MSRLTDRLERNLHEVAAAADPSPSAWKAIAARLDHDGDSGPPLAPASAFDGSKRSVWPVAAAAALLVVAGSAIVLTRVGDDQSISTAGPERTTTFVSPRNAFSVEHPEGATVTPAERAWERGEQLVDGFDVVEVGPRTVFRGTSTAFPGDLACLDDNYEEIPCGSTTDWEQRRDRLDERIDRDLSEDLPGGCGTPRRRQAKITVDGHPGRVAACMNHVEATVVFGGRLYVFTLSHDGGDARSVFDAFAATIDLTPETALDFPPLTTTFNSPLHGYSFGFLDRGGLTPAAQPWDPVDRPERVDFDDRFDAVETGLSAYFEAASTPMPDGVSIDEWVDEHITRTSAGTCGVPRGQQAEVTIDGQPGRIAECRNQIEASVTAGGRLYLFVLRHDRDDARAVLDAWLLTIELTPETAETPR